MLPFEDAEKIVWDVQPTSDTERIALSDSLQCVLAEDIIADMNMPPFNKSAVDGFACRREDLSKTLRCTGTIAAGSSLNLSLEKGTCVRIMTGAEVPSGADCVIMLEETISDKDGNIIFKAQKTSTNICYFAEDVREGEVILHKGILIKPRHIPLLASMGYSLPLIYKKPVVGIICTGSELVDASQKPGTGKIRNSNGPQLEAQCAEMNIKTEFFGIIPDSREKLRDIIRHSVSADLVTIISGGVSVGDFDYVPGIINELGFEVKFHGLNVKPGKRILFATKDNRYIFGLPGNPVSALIQFEMLVKPLLLKLQNSTEMPEMEKRILSEDFYVKDSSKMSFVPVKLNSDGTILAAEYHGSAHIYVFGSANGFMRIPAGINKLLKGSLADVRLI